MSNRNEVVVRDLALELLADREAELRTEAQDLARQRAAREADERFPDLLDEAWESLSEARDEAWQECLAEARARLA